MEFTPDLAAFQGVLMSTDTIHSFSKLTSRGGNEEKIQYVINKLLNLFEEQRYIAMNRIVDENIPTIRRLALFIILNADLSVLEDMVDNEGIDFLIWILPTIPKCLMCEMFWSLHMDQFVYESIAFCHPQLSIEVANSFVINMKYFDPTLCLDKLKLVSAAVYKLICRLHFFSFENNVMTYLLTFAFNSFQLCTNYFIKPPNAANLARLKKDEHYKYTGDNLHTMLSLINDCIEEFTSAQEPLPLDIEEIYVLTYKKDTFFKDTRSVKSCHSLNKPIRECLEKCHMVLLDKCVQLVMEVSVDIFCAWSEFEEDGKSMQQTIGELCYKLCSKLVNISSITEHPLINMIQQISRKPENLDVEFDVSDAATVIQNINKNDANKLSWVRALSQKESLCLDVALLQILISNVQILNAEECYNLYKVIQNHLDGSSDNAELVQKLAIKAFRACTIDRKYEILDERFKSCFIDMPETEEFNTMMIEIFNRFFASPSTEYYDVLSVFLQNPSTVYTRIFKMASENRQQTDIMLKVISLLKRFSNHFYNNDTEPCVIKVAQKIQQDCLEEEARQHNFVQFICGLKKIDIIHGAKLLMLIIMPSLHKALLNRDIPSISIQCRLLLEAYTLEELEVYRAPMLAMLAQVLDILRWKIDNFEPLAPNTLYLALQLQNSLFETLNTTDETTCNWLRSKLRNVQPLNLFYYRKLWAPPGDNIVEVVSGSRVHGDMDTQQLTVWLAQVLCSSTRKEWCDIWDGLAVFGDAKILDILHDTLSAITTSESNNRTDNSRACLLNCYRNFSYAVRYKFCKEPASDNQVLAIAAKIASTANLIQTEDAEDLVTIILPLFAYLVERKDNYTIDVSQVLRAELKDSKLSDLVNKVLSNGTC